MALSLVSLCSDRDYAWFLSDVQIPWLEDIYEEDGVSEENVSEQDGIPVVLVVIMVHLEHALARV